MKTSSAKINQLVNQLKTVADQINEECKNYKEINITNKNKSEKKYKIQNYFQNDFIENKNGNISFDKTEAYPGEVINVFIKITNNSQIIYRATLHFQLNNWKVNMTLKADNITFINITDREINYKFSFIMPAADVEIEAVTENSKMEKLINLRKQQQNNNQNNKNNDYYTNDYYTSQNGYWYGGEWIQSGR